jgi:hypothetical protein
MTLSNTEYHNETNSQQMMFYNIYRKYPVLIQNYMSTDFYKTSLANYKLTQSQMDCTGYNNVDEVIEHYNKCANEIAITDCIINCVYYNIGGCGYNFIETIDITYKQAKKTIFVIPYEREPQSVYLGNFLDLNETHLPMLYEIKSKYASKNTVIYTHKLSVFPKFYIFHFHILTSIVFEDLIYKRIYPKAEDRGLYISQELHLNNIINNLENDGNYYKKYNISILSNV